MNKNLFPISKEGWKYIGTSIGLFLLFLIFDLETLALLALLASIFFIFTFRNPEREVPFFEKQSVLSPVDGSVLSIDELEGKPYTYKIRIDSSYTDVSVLRSPLDSAVTSLVQQNGTRQSLENELGEKLNEKTTLIFSATNDNTLKVSHLLKQSFCPIKIDNIEKKELRQSARYGVMVHGITEICLPQNFRLNIKVGDELKASQTLVGYFS